MRNEKGQFVKNLIPWNKGTNGIMKSNKTSFKKGRVSPTKKESIIKVCAFCESFFAVKPYLNRVECCSRSCASLLKVQKNGGHSPVWKKDRTLVVQSEKKHLDRKYREWMLAIKNRDGWKCRIVDYNCNGRLEAHHILNWMDYPELRYDINNGIALCQAHHPRGRAKEKRLASYFMELVSVSKD